MIEFDDITFIYDHKPLRRLFPGRSGEGEKVVLYGPSGPGKSTLLASIAGFVLPDEGTIRIDGKRLDTATVQHVRKMTAWLPQEFTLPFDTVKALIEAPFNLRANQSAKPSDSTVLEHFSRLGLEAELYEKQVVEISGGQRQRIMLMIAALLDKKIVLLDEPTSALDPHAISLVVDYIRAMQGATVVMVSHDTRFIESFDRKIYIGD